MLTLLIPNEISAAERASQLARAKAIRKYHGIIMRHAKRRGDLRAFDRAKHMFEQATKTVQAWEAVQLPGEAA